MTSITLSWWHTGKKHAQVCEQVSTFMCWRAISEKMMSTRRLIVEIFLKICASLLLVCRHFYSIYIHCFEIHIRWHIIYLYTYTHTHIHTYTHTHIHTYTHTHIHTYTYTHMHTYTHTHIHHIHRVKHLLHTSYYQYWKVLLRNKNTVNQYYCDV